MFKWLLVAALVLSLAFCGWREYEAQRTLRETRAAIARARAEVQPLTAIDDEVRSYTKQKDALQLRIELINQLKQHQTGAADAVAKLSSVDASMIESVAVVDGQNLVINRR